MTQLFSCPICANTSTSQVTCERCGWSVEERISSHHLKPGTLLKNRYHVGRVLGQGGFGITYLGWDALLNVRIAVKEYFPLALATRNPNTMQIDPADTQSVEDFRYGLSKFLSEARTLAAFSDSPNIVSTKDFFNEYGSAYMVMEYIHGMDLKCYLEKQGRSMPWEQALAVIMHVANALKDVHAQGLLHRDISPDNIFISNRGQIKLLDFGAARFAFGAQNRSLSVILKPGYAPVEQYQSNGNQGPWSDVYSLAATLYRCITGQTPPESLARLEEDTLVPPSVMGLPVSPVFENALLKALAVKAKERFQSIEDFQAAMQGSFSETQRQSQEAHPRSKSTLSGLSGYEAPTIAYAYNGAQAAPENESIFPPSSNDKKRKFFLLLIPILGGCIAAAAIFFLSNNNAANVPGVISAELGSAGIPARENISTSSFQSKITGGTGMTPSPSLQFDKEKEIHYPAPTNFAVEPDKNGREIVLREKTAEELFLEAGELAMGIGGERDPVKAAALYEQSGQMGHIEAMLSLATLFELGQGVEKSIPQAVIWYEKALHAGSEEARLCLGKLYLDGESVKKDYAKVLSLLEDIADRGNIEAQYLVGRVFEAGGSGVNRNLRLASKYMKEPARLHYLDASVRLEKIVHAQESNE